MPLNNPDVIVGLSGGVDSSVSALLLRDQGNNVEALFMKNWVDLEGDGRCPIEQDLADAKAVSEKLAIPFHSENFAPEYWDKVFTHFLSEYRAGRTPNPDILCNKEVKFKVFLEHALNLGAKKIATGHYARIDEKNGRYRLLKAVDLNKDQTYFLYTLNQHQLAKSLFPLGELLKPKVREIAEQAGFVNYDKKDSTGICFIGERPFRSFLSRYLPYKPGEIRTQEGTIVGKHIGLMYYTIGQRQGLGIGGTKNGLDKPWFVVEKNMSDNTLIVVQGHDHPKLYRPTLSASELTWISGKIPHCSWVYSAKTRYRQTDAPCSIEKIYQDKCRIEFAQPQWAVTPGQSVVIYESKVCLGGGIITN